MEKNAFDRVTGTSLGFVHDLAMANSYRIQTFPFIYLDRYEVQN